MSLASVAFLIFTVGSSIVAEETTASTTDTEKEIRCYCNLPECVTTSYMCKSKGRGCFADIPDNSDLERVNYGCLENLGDSSHTVNSEKCGNVPSHTVDNYRSTLLLCCTEDLCNHVESPEVRTKYNNVVEVIKVRLNSVESVTVPKTRNPSYNSHEVWFKAATIAVPICGALILLVLILLAVKILKSGPETFQPKFRNKTVGVTNGILTGVVVTHNPSLDTNGGGSKKLPLLFRQNDCGLANMPIKPGSQHEKNEANAKLNVAADLIDLHKSNNRAPCNLYQPLLPPPELAGDAQKVYNKSLVCSWSNQA